VVDAPNDWLYETDLLPRPFSQLEGKIPGETRVGNNSSGRDDKAHLYDLLKASDSAGPLPIAVNSSSQLLF
jgi:hypothetical protein